VDIVKIFLSHNSKYIDLAASLKNSLHALEVKPLTQLDIKISEEMEGATDWRQWIEDNVRNADIFLLLFPHASMDMSWCNYELGRFYDGKRKIVCMKNTDIPNPPPPFQPYQAYDADEAGIRKFIDELFVRGTFTENKPLNPKVGSPTEDIYGVAQNIARQLARKFAQARMRDQFYERRIVLSVRYDEANRFDPEASTVQGNAEGVQLLGLSDAPSVPWSAVRRSIGDAEAWPSLLEQAISSIAVGSLPPTLPPFFASGMIYIPVIARVRSVDEVLKEVVVIFVAVDTDRLRPLLDWSLPASMPDSLAMLVRLVRMMFRARWDILDQRYQEVKYQSPTPEQCAEVTRSVLADYGRMQQDAVNQGIQGIDKFYGLFARDLRPDVEACGDEWVRLIDALRGAPAQDSEALAGRLKALRDNNTKWLELAAKQFVVAIHDLP
jgi:TIR domain